MFETWYGSQLVNRQGESFHLARFRLAGVDYRALIGVECGTVITPHRIKSAALSKALRERVGYYTPAETEEPEELEEGPDDCEGPPSLAYRVGAAFRVLCVAFVLALALPFALFFALTWR